MKVEPNWSEMGGRTGLGVGINPWKLFSFPKVHVVHSTGGDNPRVPIFLAGTQV